MGLTYTYEMKNTSLRQTNRHNFLQRGTFVINCISLFTLVASLKSQFRKFALLCNLLLCASALTGCQTAPKSEARRHQAREPKLTQRPNSEQSKALRAEITGELAKMNEAKRESAPEQPILSSGAANDTILVGSLPKVPPKPEILKKLSVLESSGLQLSKPNETPFIFDIPVTYNERVRTWIKYFQKDGRMTFRNWLERSSRYLPVVQYELAHAGLPQDLAYVAMVESGFSPGATSPAGAKGMWQFIPETGRRYGLRIDWWVDERRDFHKATKAAIHYMSDLYTQFNSWYLVTASYNMGEHGVRRLIQRHKTTNFWELAEMGALPQETCDYLPKIIAAMLISKAPALYGFRDLDYQMPLSFESITVPGGTDIVNLATYLGVSERYLKDLNPELIKGLIPGTVRGHRIRVPKGSMLAVSQFIRLQAGVDHPWPTRSRASHDIKAQVRSDFPANPERTAAN